MNVRRMIVATIASGLMLGAVAGGASAGNSGDGSDYGTQPGFGVANGNTPCAGHGAFGYLGKDNDMGHSNPNGPGANGYQTGINNGTLCGNRQGNLP